MTRDYVLGFMTCALLVCAVIIWLMWLGRTPDGDDHARQGVPQRYADNTIQLGEVG